MVWRRSIKVEDLADGQVRGLTIAGKKIALCRVKDDVFAMSDICTHEYALLSDGYLEGDCLECPLHAAVFHVPTGEVRSGPTTTALQTFPVKLEDGVIMVEIAN